MRSQTGPRSDDSNCSTGCTNKSTPRLLLQLDYGEDGGLQTALTTPWRLSTQVLLEFCQPVSSYYCITAYSNGTAHTTHFKYLSLLRDAAIGKTRGCQQQRTTPRLTHKSCRSCRTCRRDRRRKGLTEARFRPRFRGCSHRLQPASICRELPQLPSATDGGNVAHASFGDQTKHVSVLCHHRYAQQFVTHNNYSTAKVGDYM